MNRRRPPIAVEDLVALRRKVDKPPIIPQKLLAAEALQSSVAAPTERRVSTAVPLGDRQRRSGDANGSSYVFPVGPPLLVAVVRRMCIAVSAYCVVALRRLLW